MSDGRTLLAVHAHPDDEAISTGGALAHYAAIGVRTIVVCCTDGTAGEGSDRIELARTRAEELRASCDHLGVSEVVQLNHADSGADPDRVPGGAFARTPIDVVADQLLDVAEAHRPQVVVTYGPDGGYGHPDHIHVHQATMAMLGAAPFVQKLYFTARSEHFRQTMQSAYDGLAGRPGGVAGRRPRNTGATVGITTTIDTSATIARRRSALASHASQLAGTLWTTLPDDAFAALFDHETYVRAFDTTGAPLPETDLFAGIDVGT